MFTFTFNGNFNFLSPSTLDFGGFEVERVMHMRKFHRVFHPKYVSLNNSHPPSSPPTQSHSKQLPLTFNKRHVNAWRLLE
jgi:hypothetical protein